MGIMLGGQELVRRNLLSYQRSEEQAADLAAIRYLQATGQSPKGMLDTFARFADSGLFRSRSLDPYLLSHPLPTERVSQLERLAKQSPHFAAKDPAALQARHDLMRAKLFGFVERADTVLRTYPPSNTSPAARYARAVLAYKTGRLSEALAGIDGLLAEQPNNAYFHELKGQALLEAGRARQARRAAAARGVARPERHADPRHARAGARSPTARSTRRSANSRTPPPASPNPRTRSGISPWPMAARATSARPSSPPRRASSTAAT